MILYTGSSSYLHKTFCKYFLICSLSITSNSALSLNCSINDDSILLENSYTLIHDFHNGTADCHENFGPSGVMYHPGLDKLIIMSDKQGQYARMNTDGSELSCHTIKSKNGDPLGDVDHEAVTYADKDDGFIFIAHENGGESHIAYIRQVDLDSSKVTKIWKLNFPDGIVNNQGLESLTFVPDHLNPQGGTFYMGDQTANKILGQCELPILTNGDTNLIYDCGIEIDPGLSEVSGLEYDADALIAGHQGVLFVSSDEDNLIKAYSIDGDDLNWQRRLPDSSEPGQEGHALWNCHLFISSDANQDSQKVHRYHFTH